MNQQRRLTGSAPPWLFVTSVIGFAAYYASDVWAGRFETIAYGMLCIILLIVLGSLLVISTIRQQRASPDEAPPRRAVGAPIGLRPLLLLWLLTAYAALQAIAGFAVATFLIFSCLLWFFGERRRLHLLTLAIAMTLLAHVIFVEILSLPLPTGALVD